MNVLTQTIISNAVVATLMALAAAGITKFVRRPQIAYFLWLLVLLKLVTPPIVPLRMDWGWLRDTSQASLHDHVVGRSPDSPTAWTEGLPLPAVIGSGDPTTTASEPTAPPTAANGQPQRIHWLSLLIPVWLVGTVFWTGLAVRRTIRFRRILRRAKPAAASLRQETRRLVEKFELKRRPRVFVTEGRIPPLVWPIARRPIVLLPRALLDELSPSEQAKLVAHELAHLRRGDHRIRVLELLILALWWWHPAAWWARRRLRQAEEQCCDAWVLWAFPGTAKSYANTLLKTIDFLSDFRPAMPPAACGFHSNSPTVRRFEMILQEGLKHKASWRVRIALLAVAAAVLPIALLAGTTKSGEDAPNCEGGDAPAAEKIVEWFDAPAPASAATSAEALRAAELRKDETSPSGLKRRLMRYDGKDFAWWQQELHTELKAELRVEALQAMGAFGANGYGEEAAAEILRVMKVHDVRSGVKDEQTVCFAAELAVQKIGASATKSLIAALKSKHKNTRRFAALMLHRFPPIKEALPALIAATKDDDPGVRLYAVEALEKYGAEAVPALTKSLRDKELEVRYSAAHVLGSMGQGTKGAVPALISATKDEHRFVRKNALEALCRIRPAPEVVLPILIERLEDEDQTVQQTAINGLEQMGPRAKQAVPALIKAFSKVDRGDRFLVVRALGEIGPEAKDALPLIKEAAVRDSDEALRKAARTALPKIAK